MDRTTFGRSVLPLQRRRLIVVKRGENDARRKELHLTTAGPRLALLKELNADADRFRHGKSTSARERSGAGPYSCAPDDLRERRSVGKRH
jgi:DNA-binding MarR family transcriptional regulator